MAKQDVNLKIKGLYTAPNDFTGVPPGALDIADDIVIDQENLAEPRRGFNYVPGNLPLVNQHANNFASFQGVQIISYGGTALAYYSGAVWNTYSGTYLPPDSTYAQVRFFEANQNLYISTSTGVYKLDTYSNTPVRAGVPKGLDLQLSLTGSSGFFSTNTAATITGTTTNTSPNLTLLSSLGSIEVGQIIQGTNVPVGTTVSSITDSVDVLFTTGNITAGTTTLGNLPTNSGLVVNQLITGTGIQDGTRIVSIAGAGPYSVTMSLSAIATTVAVAVTFSSDPIITMSANATGTGAVTLNFSDGAQVAYRLIWGIKDANLNLLYGSPTQFSTITNNLGSTSNVAAVSSIPSGITTAHFYQLYRSAQTAGQTITPTDDMQLVYEGNPSSGDISNGYITITDITPDSLRGAYLYTSVSQQQISQANEPPPFCKDFCSFKNYAFYANTRSKQQLQLTILAVGSPSGIQATDILTIAGVAFTADTVENTATGHFKVYTTGTPAQNIADTANSLIKVINRYATNTSVYAYLISGPTDLPGQLLIEEKGNVGTVFYAIASTHGSAYKPTLPTSGTTVPSTQNVNKNGIIVSKQGLPEAAPSANLLFVGSASKEILRIIPLRDYIVILKQDGIFRLTGTTLQTFVISPFDLTTKLLAPNTAVSLSNEVWGLFDQGVCSVSDTGVNVRSRPIEDTVRTLIGTALSTLRTVAFGVGYETDRKYILSLPNASGDTVCQQQYVFSTFTNAWVRWTRVASAGFVDPTVDQLYFGNGLTNNVSVENKTDTYTDYVDEPFAVTIVSSLADVVTLASVVGITEGDVLYGSSTVASVVTDVDTVLKTVTVENTLTWTPGAAQIFPAISGVVQWKPEVSGNPAFVKHYAEGDVVFKRTRFTQASLAFYSDVDQSYEDTELTGFSLATFGNFSFGEEPWGGVNRPKSLRFLVPQNKQMCAQLSARLTIRNGYSNWALEGIALSPVPVSQEIG